MNSYTEYDLNGANKIFKEFQYRFDIDILTKTNKAKYATKRALLYHIMYNLNDMIDCQIEHFLSTKDVLILRPSIYKSRNKVDDYYKKHSEFKEIYDIYFADKTNLNNKIERKKELGRQKRKAMLLKKNANVDIESKGYNHDPLQVLINELPLDKRSEILGLVSLRVKSWEWKTKDNYEIIESH